PAKPVNAPRVEALLADLDHDEFAVRDRATKELARIGKDIAPRLQRALEGELSIEARKRIKLVLAKLEGPPPAEVVRTLRAVTALERIGTPEARELLKKVAGGDAAARETREAK